MAGASGSLNVALTVVATDTSVAPLAGVTGVTLGGAAAASAAICWKRSFAAWYRARAASRLVVKKELQAPPTAVLSRRLSIHWT